MILKYFLRLISYLPLWVFHLLGDFFQLILIYLFPYRKKVIEKNIKNSFPDLDPKEYNKLINQFYGYFTHIFMEFIKANSLNKKNLEDRVQLINFEEPKSYLDKNQSIIFVTGHQGNWEWGIQRLGLTNYEFEVIYQVLSNKGFNEFTYENRTRFGKIKMVERKDSIKEINSYKGTRAICLLSDQSPRKSNSAHWIKFLNQDTPFTKGMEQFANHLNLPVFYVELLKIKKGQYSLRFELIEEKPGSLNEEGLLTKKFAELLEKSIKNHKEQYLWSHNRWKLKLNL